MSTQSLDCTRVNSIITAQTAMMLLYYYNSDKIIIVIELARIRFCVYEGSAVNYIMKYNDCIITPYSFIEPFLTRNILFLFLTKFRFTNKVRAVIFYSLRAIHINCVHCAWDLSPFFGFRFMVVTVLNAT